MGQTALAGADFLRQRDLGRPLTCSAGSTPPTAPLADYFSSSTSAAKTAVDNAFETAFGCAADRRGGGRHHRLADAELSLGSFAASVLTITGRRTGPRRRARTPAPRSRRAKPSTTSTNANTPAFQTSPRPTRCSPRSAGPRSARSAQQAVASAATSLISAGTRLRSPTRRPRSARRRSQVTDANSAMSSQLDAHPNPGRPPRRRRSDRDGGARSRR